MRLRALRLLAVLALALAACKRGPSHPNVVVVTIESLRTDHVGAYGGRSRSQPDVPITPSLDALAREAMVYEDAQAVTSWTLTSHASLFTGLYPSAHQTVRARDRLDDSYTTFAEVLRDRGYQTVGIASGPYLRQAYNLQQGFELYHDDIATPSPGRSHGDVTNPQVEAALGRFLAQERDPGRPFLLFVYLWDPHYDYLPPPPHDRTFVGPDCEPFDVRNFELREDLGADLPPARMAYLLSQYDGEIRTTDELLGRFFASLKERGLWDDTAVIVTADHGEEFFDHGEKGHKHDLYAETVHVPLLVKYPHGNPKGRDARLVSHVDVFPTVLALAGAPAPTGQPGRSLLAPPPPDDRVVVFELLEEWGKPSPRRNLWGGLRRGAQKLVWKKDLNRVDDDELTLLQVFDVSRDPTERTDLSDGDPEATETLSQLFAKQMEVAQDEARRHRSGGTAALKDEDVERLRSLGYVE